MSADRDALAANYLAFVRLASIRLWLRVNGSTPYIPRVTAFAPRSLAAPRPFAKRPLATAAGVARLPAVARPAEMAMQLFLGDLVRHRQRIPERT